VSKACWRNLRSYKYQLVQEYGLDVPIRPEADIVTGFVDLSAAGLLVIRKGYAWDGPSGPTIDTPSFMRGSLVHDALYQLMRLSRLDYKVHRATADDLLKRHCLEDGMWKIRASIVHVGVRTFGEKHARPGKDEQDEIHCSPEPQGAGPV